MTLKVRAEFELREFALEVAFEAEPGITVLFGPSGAGKSRTLGVIAGLFRPVRGHIALDDEVWFDDATRFELPVHQRSIGFVPQGLALFPHMTAEQNVAYAIAGASRAERFTRARQMLSRMRVEPLAGRKPSTFSGGEAQRVALARALARSPRLLLLDEPFNALDIAVKRELMELVREHVHAARIPAILVTHDEAERAALGGSVLELDRGRLVRM